MVKDIECIHAEIQRLVCREFYPLLDAQIRVNDARPIEEAGFRGNHFSQRLEAESRSIELVPVVRVVVQP